MNVSYRFTDINKKGMAYGIGDLIKYYADVSMQVKERMQSLDRSNAAKETISSFLLKKTGLDVEQLSYLIKSKLDAGDVFYFTVDGVNIVDLFKDKEELEIELHMDENYFITMMMYHKYVKNPFKRGFRQKFPEGIEGEHERWIDWFEHEWKTDLKFKGCNNPHFTKTILED